jgi:membrane-bound inhibitor of C-type lysozyme
VKVFKVLGNEINNVQFQCADDKSIHAVFYKNAVHIITSIGIEAFLHQTISASGARYANDDESLVFWNKGDTSFLTQGEKALATYSNCKLVETK